MSTVTYTLTIVALVIIASLAFYAGKLLFMLKKQNNKRAQIKQERIQRIMESIHTIAMAVEQRQCNLSEGSIRLFHLWESLPIDDKPEYRTAYPGLYGLYQEVNGLATHEARHKLSTLERTRQDDARERTERELETQILSDVTKLRTFTP